MARTFPVALPIERHSDNRQKHSERTPRKGTNGMLQFTGLKPSIQKVAFPDACDSLDTGTTGNHSS
jgi:hypothetical protein